MSNQRKCLTFALAPLVPSVFFLFELHLSDPRQAAFVLLFFIAFSYLPCLIFGVPLMKALQRYNSLDFVSLTLYGGLLGVVAFYAFGLVISVVLGSPKGVIPECREIFSGALLGVSMAAPFSLIAGLPILKMNKR
ncbi:hypothetical protein HX882_32135 [Pseudomonas gingeri]|uniref:Uncharacterized protein n=1 Tax=Pseudomonas gingeri TaxID=117681 RepID=A0A7Y8C593_9PSED|nr:hypothetical protein [Pseudomonas gingeri]NWC00531.1 hypothetical protein [Pseudomonas gingeri]